VQQLELYTQLDHLTGAVLIRHLDADGRVTAGECRWCRQVVPAAKLVGDSRLGAGFKWICRRCRRARRGKMA
jgi:hypothetical protein